MTISPFAHSRRAPVERQSIKRFVTSAPITVRAESDRSIDHIFSDELVGRDGDRIFTSGWDLTNYLNNPVYLWAHDLLSPPIGRVSRISPDNDGVLRGTVQYATADELPFADQIWRLTRGGYINASSVSWLPIKWKYSTDKSRPGGVDHLEQELLEISAVPLPALPTALITARSAGIDITEMANWAEMEMDQGRSSLNRRDLIMIRGLAQKSRSIHYSTTVNSVRRDGRAAAAPFAQPTRGLFGSFGEFLHVVARGAVEHSRPDPRLTPATRFERAPGGSTKTILRMEGSPSPTSSPMS